MQREGEKMNVAVKLNLAEPQTFESLLAYVTIKHVTYALLDAGLSLLMSMHWHMSLAKV
jgi:hypothetical protein